GRQAARHVSQDGVAFEDDGVLTAVGRDGYTRLMLDVLRLACAYAGAEPQRAVDPHSPDDRGVRRSIRTNRRQEVVARGRELVDRERPRQELDFGSILRVIGPIWLAGDGFGHVLSASGSDAAERFGQPE